MSKITNILASLKRILTTPVDELSRAQLHIRNAIELIIFCGRKMKDDRATQMAAALTYRTIFSLVPLTVLALLVFKAFGGFEGVGSNAQEYVYDYLGFTNLASTPQQQSSTSPTNPHITTEKSTPPSSQTTPLSSSPTPSSEAASTPSPSSPPSTQPAFNLESVDEFFNNLSDQVNKINFTGIGFLGVAILIWSAVSLLITIERSFNTIYQCPSGRAWHMRIITYWAIITLGPILISISIFITNKAFGIAHYIPGLTALLAIFSSFTALIISWILLFLLYTLMPNTRVRLRTALIGSFVSAALWELGKYGFKLYVYNALSINSVNTILYGSLGLVLIFLLWIYITWLIIVFGLEITSTLQLFPGQRLKKRQQQVEAQANLSSDHLLLLMAAAAHNFHLGSPTTADSLATTLSLSTRSVDDLAAFLVENHLLHRISDQSSRDRAYTLARPPHEIRIADLLTLAHEQTSTRIKDTQIPAANFLDTIIEAQKSAAQSRTLADIIDTPPPTQNI